MVLLSEPRLPSAEAILEQLRSIAPAVATGVTTLATTPDESATLRVTGLGELFVALAHGPVPNGEAEALVPFSVCALGTGWRPQPHSDHAVIAFNEQGELPVVERLRLFTFLTAAVVAASAAVGVYWGDAHATHEPEFFVKVARALDILPIMLWTGVAVDPAGEHGVRVLSTSMHRLGLPELMLIAPAVHVREAGAPWLDFFFGLLAHFAYIGRAPATGELVGRTHEEQLPVGYQPSPLRPNEQVWTVHIPESATTEATLAHESPR